jgi:hypothetical protein
MYIDLNFLNTFSFFHLKKVLSTFVGCPYLYLYIFDSEGQNVEIFRFKVGVKNDDVDMYFLYCFRQNIITCCEK